MSFGGGRSSAKIPKPPYTPAQADPSIIAAGLRGMNPIRSAYNATAFPNSLNSFALSPSLRPTTSKRTLMGGNA